MYIIKFLYADVFYKQLQTRGCCP